MRWKRSENGQKKLIKEVKNTKIEILTIYSWMMRALLEKKNSIWGEKSKIGCLWTQLDFIKGLIEFIKGLIARKIEFWSQFRALIGRN